MSTIDDLHRLHEAATHSDLKFHEWTEQVDKAWPAIHRVLVAARACQGGDAKDLAELADALRALDDKEQRT